MGRWLHRLAVLTAASTLGLVFIGGLVTSTGSGLAVPDWPLSYGSLFPRMAGGVLYEHGHRMAAAVVGLLTVALAAWALAGEKRRWVGRLAAGALAAVVLQGMLGGLTVLLLLPPAVSVLHACLAQAFLCLVVALAAVTGPAWIEVSAREARPMGAPARAAARAARPAALLAACVFAQLILGAVMRHSGAGLAIPDFPLAFGKLVPPLGSLPVLVSFAHRVGALVVCALASWTALRLLRAGGPRPAWLVRPMALVLALLAAQVTLGALTIWTRRAILPTTAHVACGAAVLAASLVLAMRAALLTRPARGADARPAGRVRGTPLHAEAAS